METVGVKKGIAPSSDIRVNICRSLTHLDVYWPDNQLKSRVKIASINQALASVGGLCLLVLRSGEGLSFVRLSDQ
jgi:hypothetical protein